MYVLYYTKNYESSIHVLSKQPRSRSATLELGRKLFTGVAPPHSIGGGCLRLPWSAGYAFRELRREKLHREVLVRQGALHVLLGPALALEEPRCMGTFRPACFVTADDGEILRISELTTVLSIHQGFSHAKANKNKSERKTRKRPSDERHAAFGRAGHVGTLRQGS